MLSAPSQELRFGRKHEEAETPKRVEEFVKTLLDPQPQLSTLLPPAHITSL